MANSNAKAGKASLSQAVSPLKPKRKLPHSKRKPTLRRSSWQPPTKSKKLPFARGQDGSFGGGQQHEQSRSEGFGTVYIETLSAGKSYKWKQNIITSSTAAVGTHQLTVMAECEDKSDAFFSASDTLNVDVRQPAKLDFDGAKLSVKSYQCETQSVTQNLLNTSESTLYNCKIDFAVKRLDSGGSVFVGEIAQGENKSGTENLRVSEDLLGKTEGEITITYEDSFGESYEKPQRSARRLKRSPKKPRTKRRRSKRKTTSVGWFFSLDFLSAAVQASA